MPLIHLTRADNKKPFDIDCCDPRYDLGTVVDDNGIHLAVLDRKANKLVEIRETQAELDAIMAIAHPENAPEVTS